MSDFIILTDSTTDLEKSFYEASGCFHEPHGFVLDGIERKDVFWTNMSENDYFSALKGGAKVSTTQPEMVLIEQHAEEAFKQGKDVLYICFSAQLSGTYNTACMVGNELTEKYPGRKMYVVDSRCASRAQGWLVEKAVKMRDAGKGMDEVIEVIEAEKDKLYHFFTVDDLMHLKRGGRLSGTSAVVGTLVGIKPVLHMSDDGRLETIGKVRGRKNALDELVKLALEKIDDSTDIVYIPSADCASDAEYVADALKNAGVKNILVYTLGPNIVGHTGCGTLGVLFHSEK